MRAGVHQVVTFAAEPFRGNPAFVISLERDVSDTVLQQVAAQLKEPVLASLRPAGSGRTRLLFHTATGRHPGAGHSMLAAAHVALAGKAHDSFVFELAGGSECVVSRQGSRIAVPWPVMPGVPVDLTDALSAALGVRVSRALDAPFGYVAVCEDAAAVADMRPDMGAVARLERGTVIATAAGDVSDIVLRAFAPRLGLPEDPVCGTAHRIIVPYWADRLKRAELHSRQLSERGGDLWCRLDGERVVIAGESAIFLSGSIDLPDN